MAQNFQHMWIIHKDFVHHSQCENCAQTLICLFVYFISANIMQLWYDIFFSSTIKFAVWITSLQQTEQRNKRKWERNGSGRISGLIDVMEIVDRSRGFQTILCSEFENNTKTVNGVKNNSCLSFICIIQIVHFLLYWGERQMRKNLPQISFNLNSAGEKLKTR